MLIGTVLIHQHSLLGLVEGMANCLAENEGPNCGDQHLSLEQKVSHVLRQLARNEAIIMFDSNSETIDIVVGRKAKSSGSSD